MNKPAIVDDYLRNMTGKHGKVFMARPLPTDMRLGKMNECFANCILIANSSDGEYLYCEGLAIHNGEAYAHAWLTDKDRKYAYDPTWRITNDLGEVHNVALPVIYKGVVLEIESVINYWRHTHLVGVLVNHTERPKALRKVLHRSGLL